MFAGIRSLILPIGYLAFFLVDAGLSAACCCLANAFNAGS